MRSLAIGIHEVEFSSALCPVPPIERLQMAQRYHVPVLEKEITDLFVGVSGGVIIDATLGGAGHTKAFLDSNPGLKVIGIDRDAEARAEAGTTLAAYGERVRIVAATFAEIDRVVSESAAFIGDLPIVGVLMDLGVSSHQLDAGERGFSFRADAPLDMRMDQSQGVTAAQYIETVDLHAFARLLRENGESRFAGAIARAVIEANPQTTNELSAAVESAVPMAARRRGHVATRVFQALRIAVNNEEAQLDEGLRAALQALSVDGLLVVISYHSGEDKVVKEFFRTEQTGGCTCVQALGCVCGAVSRVAVFKASAQMASAQESEENPRARSARLRIARKVTA
jgi:16S rRNA (cytosine1402-N4)-methyltransferase